MTRSLYLALGAALGAVAMAALVAVAADSPTMDPVKISPQYYTVRVDNDRVRSVRMANEARGEGEDAQSPRRRLNYPRGRKD